MKRFLDSSVLVEACLSQSPNFAKADGLVSQPDAFTSAHAFLESYATLSRDARLKVLPADAAGMVEGLASLLKIRTLEVAEVRQLIASAPAKGIRGGGIYDALHAQTARKSDCKEIHTLNLTHFKHAAPDLTIVGL